MFIIILTFILTVLAAFFSGFFICSYMLVVYIKAKIIPKTRELTEKLAETEYNISAPSSSFFENHKEIEERNVLFGTIMGRLDVLNEMLVILKRSPHDIEQPENEV